MMNDELKTNTTDEVQPQPNGDNRNADGQNSDPIPNNRNADGENSDLIPNNRNADGQKSGSAGQDAGLRKPDVTRFNISDHLEFHKQAYVICIAVNTTKAFADRLQASGDMFAAYDDMFTAYDDAVKQEETVFKWIHKSEITAKKAKTDHARDHAVKGIAAVVRAAMKHFDPAIRDHALHVYGLLEAYGNIPATDYDGETANIDSLLTRIKSDSYAAAVAALALGAWIGELEAQNNLFKTYVDDYANEQIAKPAIEPRAARRQTDDALRTITGFFNAIITVLGTTSLATFITAFNTLVNHYNNIVREHYGRLHARIDITPAVIAFIPEQPCTGKPVFVIPELTLTVERDGKQTVLHPEFSVDFTVAYKNNIDPGTATLIITGIGKFVGEIVTTFNIKSNV
jgi:hypothetical protein